jgi:hypothetical protein
MPLGNEAHQHLLVNHLPIFGAFLAVPMLLMALLLRKERGLLLASVFLLVAAALGGWISSTTGERAMAMVEKAQDKGLAWSDEVDDAALAEHEERADKAMIPAAAVALLGVVLLVVAHRRPADRPLPRIAIAALLLGAVATSAAMAWVGNAGGVVMHREIRGDSLDSVTPKAK